jgi:RNA polymerase sigma factor (sigma-70 family)
VRKLTHNISSIYKQSVSHEDAHQIGSFGVARAAYRYHPSIGLRFSTYASHWIQKEIQRQSLEGRLIRISSNLVEKISLAGRNGNSGQQENAYNMLSQATAQLAITAEKSSQDTVVALEDGPHQHLERKELRRILLQAIEKLPEKSKDVIMRRFGLGKYSGNTQSVIEISNTYGVTRGSIYQLEQTAFKHLRGHLTESTLTSS